MKTLFALALFATSVSAQAINVDSAQYNPATNAIDAQISYSGGCVKPNFQLQFESCLERHPVACTATVINISEPDFCEAYISQMVSFPLRTFGLNDPYFSGASVRLNGPGQTNGPVVLLPRK